KGNCPSTYSLANHDRRGETGFARRSPLQCPPTMLKLFRLLAPARGSVAIVCVLARAQSLGFLLLPRLMSDIVDKGIVRGDQRAIFRIGGLMRTLYISATSCAVL